ncbi:hypothetical protein U9M48_028915, partial [Paspalum notatum var. saurae]
MPQYLFFHAAFFIAITLTCALCYYRNNVRGTNLTEARCSSTRQLGDKYKDEPPNTLELFKECHYSKKRKAFTPTVQSVINEIEYKIADPIEDGETPRNVTEVVSDVLVHETKKNRFLCNVGIRNKPGTSNAMRRELEAELAREKQGSDELRALVDKHRLQMDAMAKEAESARAQN